MLWITWPKKLKMKNDSLIEFTPLFNKQRKASPLEIKEAFRETLELFIENPTHKALRNHFLTGQYAGFRSIDVTDNWRALYRQESGRVIFVDIGTHDQLYG